MTEIETFLTILLTIGTSGIAFAVGIAAIRRIMGQQNDERRLASLARTTGSESPEAIPDPGAIGSDRRTI